MVTVRNVNKYFPESNETQKGHMQQIKQGVRSTKLKEIIDETFPTVQTEGKKRDIMIKVMDMKEIIATDQTGKFPVTSSREAKYLMVMCEIDGNVILVETMKSRTEGEMIKAYLTLVGRLRSAGIQPKHQILDNKASEEYKKTIKESGMTYKLVPPDMHRQNRAEKAIQTFKDHFVAILSGVDESFPMHLWDRLLPQAEMTLNILRQSNVAPKVSAYAYMNGPYDFNKMPLAPMGCSVQVHDKPNKRKMWDAHSSDGWYLGTSHKHYRCFKIYKKETRAEMVSDMVYFKHKYITMPTITKADMVIQAAKDLTQALEQNVPNAIPATNVEALRKLATAFEEIAQRKHPDERWDEPARPMVLEADKHTSVTKPVPIPRVNENPERLIVTSTNKNGIESSPPAAQHQIKAATSHKSHKNRYMWSWSRIIE